MFGKLGVLDDEPDITRVQCLEDVTVYTLSRADFAALVYAKPQVGLAMMRELANEIRNLTLLAMWFRRTSEGGSRIRAAAGVSLSRAARTRVSRQANGVFPSVYWHRVCAAAQGGESR
ncbi:MAG: hypothetical protein KatS3mg051_1107 [Anaerolineae bacterium]|nr:MAG: hypothetical protein KatS3mg051_1107 [Anaerolineae bacterium]